MEIWLLAVCLCALEKQAWAQAGCSGLSLCVEENVREMSGGREASLREVCTVHRQVKWLLLDWVSVLPGVLTQRKPECHLTAHAVCCVGVAVQTRAQGPFYVLYLLLFSSYYMAGKKGCLAPLRCSSTIIEMCA